ncbi:SAM-dependent methyltransferase [Maritimibacter dapengensis]|uniref:Class I SAM-dependent methyltransferase n=1 Tax=Maritimibacter dapengensis TaxID=2836868 RepID=A0ABS6T1F8_9RHOB|nr:class I SAM-dependent methyltransferase [Maritimibacter dapengensis]MBV7378212.1 class I SAM-dependent methyltransferase [Maritimibacter dapengensis]
MWNQRFDTDEYIFGKTPSQFLVSHEGLFAPGLTALAIADGEGRNSVWLAEQGLDVTAMEGSPNAIAKARKLAEERGVDVSFREADIFTYDWDTTNYDFVIGVFFQFMGPDAREDVFAGMKRATKPSGRVLIHGYTPKQLEYGTGGPKAIENLYTEEMLAKAFAGWKIERLESYETELDEGAGHAGMSAVIDLVAQKPG